MTDVKSRLTTVQWVIERNLAWIAAADVKAAVVALARTPLFPQLASPSTTPSPHPEASNKVTQSAENRISSSFSRRRGSARDRIAERFPRDRGTVLRDAVPRKALRGFDSSSAWNTPFIWLRLPCFKFFYPAA